jgi:hypothetical protein
MWRALPDAQLAVVPGTTHALPMEKPELTNRLILDFLATEQVPKMMALSQMLDLMDAASATGQLGPARNLNFPPCNL